MKDILRDVFGHAAFRGLQEPAVTAFLGGRDALVVMPTGAGKSLCFQLPAVVWSRGGRGVTVVVSPLIALMEDQVAALRARGVAAACLHSAQDELDQYRTEADFLTGRLALIYLSPERLGAPSFLRHLSKAPVAAIVVDEAHCISSWGHDFRPDFRAIAPRIAALRERAALPVMALTASATPLVINDVQKTLQLRSPLVVRGGFARENLALSVEIVDAQAERDARVLALLDELGMRGVRVAGRAILYAATRKRAESAAELLQKHGVSAACYHAGMADAARERVQHAFAMGRTPVLVATSAFGMGVDQPDVRVVVHLQAPGSLEAYYQEAGRAGRDGAPARCVLFFGAADLVTQRVLLRKGRVTAPLMDAREAALKALADYATSTTCRAATVVAHFEGVEARLIAPCGKCDVCQGAVAAPQVRERRAVAQDVESLGPDELIIVLDAARALRKPVGKTVLARALRGSNAAEVRRKGLLRNPRHGALAHRSEASIVAAIEGFVVDRTLVKKGVKYPTVWPAGKDVRQARVAGARPRESGLLAALKRWRQLTARSLGWKPYMVLPNVALKQMAERRPFTRDELLAIRGMGPQRLERFGTELLVLLAHHADGQSTGSTDP